MGFLDLHGGLGRTFGSLGVSLQDVYTHLTLRQLDPNALEASSLDESNSRLRVTGGEVDRIRRYASIVLDALSSDLCVDIESTDIITPHAGLGSGTQLALAVGLGISRLLDREDTPEQIALMLGRGKRSSIGINTFISGGFVLDGGHGESSVLPPVLSRLPFPEQWRLLLLLDHDHCGIHGSRESTAFRDLPPLPEQACAHLCRLVLMKLLPGLVESDLDAFGSAVTEVQQIVGDHFAPAQGGRFASERVATLLGLFEQEGARGLGQSSWGPTGFVICPSEDVANRWLDAVLAAAPWQLSDVNVEAKLCTARNTAGTIKIL